MQTHLQRLSCVGMICGITMIGFGAYWPSSSRVASEPAFELKSSEKSHVPIESIRVGDRVLTGTDADHNISTCVALENWKKVSIRAEWSWPDGTLDVFAVETLQGPKWLAERSATIGQMIPLPLDVHEMGCPEDLQGEIIKLEACPRITNGPGKVVLTTVSHLNPRCRELVVVDAQGIIDRIRTTDFHPFWSETKQGWVKAYTLSIGDQLLGLVGERLTLQSSQRIEGVHTVYNLTVEDEHVYRVGLSNALVHNNDCFDDAVVFQSQHGGGILNIHGEPLRGLPDRVSPIPTPPGHDPNVIFFDHAVNINDGRIYDSRLPDGMDVDDWINQYEQVDPALPFHIDPWYPGGPRHAQQ